MLPTTKRVKRTKTAEQALISLMRLCSRAERSSGDAKRLMATWEVPLQDRAGVLQRLKAERFIDDERYAMAFVREKVNLNGWVLSIFARITHKYRIISCQSKATDATSAIPIRRTGWRGPRQEPR